jgi:hypothetical protein
MWIGNEVALQIEGVVNRSVNAEEVSADRISWQAAD